MGFLSDHMPDAYKRVSRTLGTSLLLGDAEAWAGFAVVLSARLATEERAALTWAALRSLSPQHATAAYHAAILPEPVTAMEQAAIEYRKRRDRTNVPARPLQAANTVVDPLKVAINWVGKATPDQVDACCVACFQRMSKQRKAQFLDYAEGVAA